MTIWKQNRSPPINKYILHNQKVKGTTAPPESPYVYAELKPIIPVLQIKIKDNHLS